MQQLNTTLDHLIFGCYSLDEAVDFIDQQLGVQAETGGRHLTMGTYNKLLKLDDTTYFEIIAIDPEGKKPDRPRWFNMDKFGPGSKPQLIESPQPSSNGKTTGIRHILFLIPESLY
jgi:hypothetical protein